MCSWELHFIVFQDVPLLSLELCSRFFSRIPFVLQLFIPESIFCWKTREHPGEGYVSVSSLCLLFKCVLPKLLQLYPSHQVSRANKNTCKLELMEDRFYIVFSIDKNCSMWFMHLDMNRKQREVWTHAYKWAEAI